MYLYCRTVIDRAIPAYDKGKGCKYYIWTAWLELGLG